MLRLPGLTVLVWRRGAGVLGAATGVVSGRDDRPSADVRAGGGWAF